MKNLSLTLCLLFALTIFSCKEEKKSDAEERLANPNVAAQQVTASSAIDNEGVLQTCITCSNGYKFCCDSPKSPVVNCIKKTGKCE